MDRLNEIAEKCLDNILKYDGEQDHLFQSEALKAIKAALVEYGQPSQVSHPIVEDNLKSWKDLQFKIFMDRYGKRVGTAAAHKKWMKLTKREIERILDTVLDFVTAHPDPQFRPYPLTYLNQRRWEDEIILKHPQHAGTEQRNTWSY